MSTKIIENLAKNGQQGTDGSGRSISHTDITDIKATLDTSASVLTISWTSKTDDDTIAQTDESSGVTKDPTPPTGETQFQITEGSSSTKSKIKYSQCFDYSGNVGDEIFVWTQTNDSEDDKTDRGTEVAVQDGTGGSVIG